MLIKIKLEPQSLKALSTFEKISYFSIEDDATIIDLKIKIEKFVNVPAERQEIRTLITVFQNSWYVKEVCDVRGSAIMLYAYDECNEFKEPQFVSFMQIYTDELATQQQELEERSKLPVMNSEIVTSNSASAKLVTLIANSDTDTESENSDTETSSHGSVRSNLESDCGGGNYDSLCGRKRSKYDTKCSIDNKKFKYECQCSETLYQHLDEVPSFSKKDNSTADNVPDKKMQNTNEFHNRKTIVNDFNSLCKLANVEQLNGNNLLENSCQQKSSESNCTEFQSNIITSIYSKQNSDRIHPCYSINPEIRDYLAIICFSADGNSISNTEYEELLIWFFDRFRACDSCNDLQFDNKNALSLFEGKIWIACMNMGTFEWISENITKYALKLYKTLALRESSHHCEVVVPVISNNKNVLDIFDLLEKQNKNITTLKWSLRSRRLLVAGEKDFNDKAISTFCTNELFNIALDSESRNYIEKYSFKLKYCFWQIVFKFI